LGHAYALLFGVAEGKRADAVLRNTHVTPAGVPCVWPTFPRYRNENGTSFGRHSGTVWPQIQGFWAQAAARFGKRDVFAHELFNLAKHANRDKQFAEIYHPLTGEIYGGMQEAGKKGIVLWRATSRQTWAATAYIRMILTGLLGMRFSPDGVRFKPCLPEGVTRVELRGLIYRRMSVDVAIRGKGRAVQSIRIDGQARADALLSARGQGKKTVSIVLE
jgi:glycogen debranching enzyme